MINRDLFQKIMDKCNKRNYYPGIDMFIFQNEETILKALKMNVSIKTIYDIIIDESGIKVSYPTVLKKIKKLKAENKIQPKQLQQENVSVTSVAAVITDEMPNNKNEEQKPPLSKNKQKLEALKKKLEETDGIIDGDKYRDKFVWTPTRRE
ncbi:MAG: TraK family protein [Mucispirillum sp.]|nr:TraK family protein [Mucispirillum sp.]